MLGISFDIPTLAVRSRKSKFAPSAIAGLGAWYDPSDLSTLFQDAAMTVPVTSGGDPVGAMLDKSGNGNHLTQAVATKRPTFRTHDANDWLEFDGIDDELILASDIDFLSSHIAVLDDSPAVSPLYSSISNTGQYAHIVAPTKISVDGSVGDTGRVRVSDAFEPTGHSGTNIDFPSAVLRGGTEPDIISIEMAGLTKFGVLGRLANYYAAARFYGIIFVDNWVAGNELEKLRNYLSKKVHLEKVLLHLEGDSLMAGAYGNNLREELAKLVGTNIVISTAQGGSEIGTPGVLGRMADTENSYLLKETTVIWDGSTNGLTSATNYVDLIQDSINLLLHNRFLIVAPINPFGSIYAGSVPEQIYTEMLSRWPDNVVHWNDWLVNTNNSIDIGEFHDAPSDAWHLSQIGAQHVAVGIAQELASRGWTDADPADLMLRQGSAWLLDVANLPSGVPANGAVLPNAAFTTALDMIGSGNATTLGTRVVIHDTNGGADLFAERTAKNGLHVITSQDSAFAGGSTQGYFYAPETAIQQFIDDHTDDKWYFSIWQTYTRAPINPPGGTPATNASKQPPLFKAQNTGNYLLHLQDDETPRPTSGTHHLGTLTRPDNTGYVVGEPQVRAVGTKGYTGTKPVLGTISAGGYHNLYAAQGSGGAWGYFNNGAAPSSILYRVYAENLTISGRSFADAAATDELLFNVAFGAGGQFESDTFSDPDTTLA